MCCEDHSGVFGIHLKRKRRGEKHEPSFLEAVKDHCCPNYEMADALFNNPTYIGKAGYEQNNLWQDLFFFFFFAPHFKSNFNKCATSIHFTWGRAENKPDSGVCCLKFFREHRVRKTNPHHTRGRNFTKLGLQKIWRVEGRDRVQRWRCYRCKK